MALTLTHSYPCECAISHKKSDHILAFGLSQDATLHINYLMASDPHSFSKPPHSV